MSQNTSISQSRQDEANYILVARMENARNLSSILKAINFREVHGDSCSNNVTNMVSGDRWPPVSLVIMA